MPDGRATCRMWRELLDLSFGACFYLNYCTTQAWLKLRYAGVVSRWIRQPNV